MVTCYVDQIAPDNWLTVKTEPSGVRISLPYGLKLELTGTTGGREQFTVLEGINEGKRCSVTQKDGGGSYLTANLRHRPAGTVVFDLAAQSLTFGDRGPYNAFSGGGFQEFTPVAKGQYPLAIPAFPTAQTRPAYLRWTKFHRTWFRIGTDPSGSRFLHPGEISEGCVTVRQFAFNPAEPNQPEGFSDLRGMPGGATGVPLPQQQAPVIGWDTIYYYLRAERWLLVEQR